MGAERAHRRDFPHPLVPEREILGHGERGQECHRVGRQEKVGDCEDDGHRARLRRLVRPYW